jgi:hypothetical protein
MPKGFYTQSAMVLLEQPLAMSEVEQALEGCTKRATLQFEERDAQGVPLVGGTNWAGTDVLAIDLRADARGALLVDVVSAPWPDRLGFDESGKEPEDPRLFTALTTGQFGPFVYPQCLARAAEMGRADVRGLAHVQEGHRAFLRLRASWALQRNEADPIVPDDYDPREELRFVTEIAANLLELPGGLCYFNPNGEVLASAKELEEGLDSAEENEVLPLELWANLRFLQIADLDGWALVDCIGLPQLDLPDHEVWFRKEVYDPREVAVFLRRMGYAALRTAPIEDGQEAMGPGNRRWRALADRISVVPAPRPVIRWIALDGSESELPPVLLEKPRLDEEEV